MAASSTNSWLNTSLLSPSSQQQSAQHALYGPDVHLHPSSHHLPHLEQHHHQQMGGLGHDNHSPCGAYCQPQTCPLSLDFHQTADSHQLHDFSKPAGGSSSGGQAVKGSGDYGGSVSARKIHKADREKLRRDRLNEQFAELAGVLDPDRPKNDKATILGDGVQVVKELRSEVKRLRTEHTSLMDESRDLAQEKTELREERAALKSETEVLQTQLQQRLRLMMPWVGMDPSMMVGAPPYGYAMPVPQQVSAPLPTSETNQPQLQGSLPQQVSAAPPYMPLPSPAPGPFALHPAALQAYAMYSGRPGDGNTPYLPYPHYPSQVSSHPQVERPYPQYASPMQPYLMQMQAHQGQTPITGAPHVPSMYQSFAPSMPLMPPRTDGMHPNGQARVGQRHPDSAYGPHGPPILQPYLEVSGAISSVQTTLQLQTPVQPQPQRPSHLETEGSSKAETGGTGSSNSELQRENQPAIQNTQTSVVGNSTDFSAAITTSAVLASPGASTTQGRGERAWAKGGGGGDTGVLQQQDQIGTHDPTLRPPAA